MKKLLLLVMAAMVSLSSFAQPTPAPAVLRHVVLFSFKAASTPEEVQQVAMTFAGLYGKVPQVKAFEWGINNSPEKLNQGFTHCFVLSFSSEKDLADYQLHPAHLEFQKVLKPHMDKVFVVDYWVK
ncbi:Dabb family protein [Flavihumibacter fluvii]|uniref:Dabb family protein n=1 Tax=Flavihumibacter fluvii TaxID=2838157 RepID=UPI001BDE3CAE|nr:Dabb family protein [Flavihumibacter fluvii]ULQ51800.1 Dabb family protein [Flavihumibacter fluvii]